MKIWGELQFTYSLAKKPLKISHEAEYLHKFKMLSWDES